MIEIIKGLRFPHLLLATAMLLVSHSATLLAQQATEAPACRYARSVMVIPDATSFTGEASKSEVRQVSATLALVGFTLADAGISNECQEADIELTVEEDLQAQSL